MHLVQHLHFSHISIFACADRLGITDLCDEATMQFLSVELPTGFTATWFEKLLQLIDQNTSSATTPLRQQAYAKFLRRYIDDNRTSEALKRHEPLGFDLAVELQSTRREAGLQRHLAEERSNAAKQADSYYSALEQLRHRLGRKLDCMTCRAPMYTANGGITMRDTKYDQEGKKAVAQRYFLKCPKCATNEYLN
jgi:hypothetical protein